MLGFLFRGLTATPERGAALFDLLTAEARRPHWYLQGAVPDSIDGRFAVLATVTALAIVRLEQAEDRAEASVAVTERFIEVMEAEHREIGLGDPTLGRQVRRLVSSLSRRVDQWRSAVSDESQWDDAARGSLYKADVSDGALMHSARALREVWTRLGRTGIEELVQGRLG